MNTDELIKQLKRIPGAKVGNGPAHPDSPDSTAAPRIESFLDAYPSLRQDECYVDFLKKYAGASIENDDYTQLVDIFGFSDASIDMLDTDEGPVVTDGFLPFAQCVYHVDTETEIHTRQYYFAFDVSGERNPGVYRYVTSTSTAEGSFLPHLDNFCDWLEEIVRNGGSYAHR